MYTNSLSFSLSYKLEQRYSSRILEAGTRITMRWATLSSYLTPPVLFLLLNVMIATIAFTTFISHPSLHNINIHKSLPLEHKPEPFITSVNFESEAVDDKLYASQQHHTISQPSIANSHQLDDVAESPSLDEVYGRHVVRTRSETSTQSPPEKLPAKIKKSASMKSPFAHFEENDVVEARRPATTKPIRVTEGDEEVDAKADDFINRFKMQLKLQRMDSIVRYKEMIDHGG